MCIRDRAITDGDGVYGIPYAVEGYGIIYNDAIMKKYFALPDKAVDISDTKEIKNFDTLKTCLLYTSRLLTFRCLHYTIGGVKFLLRKWRKIN